MPRPFRARRPSHAIAVTVVLAVLGAVSPPTIAASAEAVPVPGDPLTGSGAVNRAELTAGQLTEGAATDTVSDSAFALPAQAAPPTHSFQAPSPSRVSPPPAASAC
jgi:hypothetical protein